MASLHVLKGPNTGQKLPLTKSVTIVGREAKDCDVVIPNQAVSRIHAQIMHTDGQYYIEDLKSRNHTYVNNKLVESKTPLRDNDRIKICDSLFTFHLSQDNLPPLPVNIRKPEPSDDELELPSTVQATVSRMPQQQLLEAQPAERLRALFEISGTLHASADRTEVLNSVVKVLLNLFKQADRCMIILRDEASDQLAVRNFSSRRPTDDVPKFSRTIVRRCLEQAEPFLVEDATTDSKFSLSQSITDFRIRSVMIAPLDVGDQPAFGVIQLDTQDKKRFTEDDLKLLFTVARQAATAIDNARLNDEKVRRERELRDLEIAKQVQHSFLPQQCPQVQGYEFFAYYKSALSIGGDYYDFFMLPDGRWAILLGDVSGKGVPAALLMAKLSIEAKLHMLTQPDASAAFCRINESLLKSGLSDRFVTMSGAILDPIKNTVQVINAGHLAPLVFNTESEEFRSSVEVERGSFPLGVDDEASYEVVEYSNAPGDVLLVFTDGVTDALNPDSRPFGIEGVKQALCIESATTSTPSSPAAVGKRVIDAVRAHIAGRDQYDDIALVTFGRYDAPPASGSNTRVGLSTSDQRPLGGEFR